MEPQSFAELWKTNRRESLQAANRHNAPISIQDCPAVSNRTAERRLLCSARRAAAPAYGQQGGRLILNCVEILFNCSGEWKSF